MFGFHSAQPLGQAKSWFDVAVCLFVCVCVCLSAPPPEAWTFRYLLGKGAKKKSKM